eukprot:jgi/Chlat1/6571/Chrsp45S05940
MVTVKAEEGPTASSEPVVKVEEDADKKDATVDEHNNQQQDNSKDGATKMEVDTDEQKDKVDNSSSGVAPEVVSNTAVTVKAEHVEQPSNKDNNANTNTDTNTNIKTDTSNNVNATTNNNNNNSGIGNTATNNTNDKNSNTSTVVAATPAIVKETSSASSQEDDVVLRLSFVRNDKDGTAGGNNQDPLCTRAVAMCEVTNLIAVSAPADSTSPAEVWLLDPTNNPPSRVVLRPPSAFSTITHVAFSPPGCTRALLVVDSSGRARSWTRRPVGLARTTGDWASVEAFALTSTLAVGFLSRPQAYKFSSMHTSSTSAPSASTTINNASSPPLATTAAANTTTGAAPTSIEGRFIAARERAGNSAWGGVGSAVALACWGVSALGHAQVFYDCGDTVPSWASTRAVSLGLGPLTAADALPARTGALYLVALPAANPGQVAVLELHYAPPTSARPWPLSDLLSGWRTRLQHGEKVSPPSLFCRPLSNLSTFAGPLAMRPSSAPSTRALRGWELVRVRLNINVHNSGLHRMERFSEAFRAPVPATQACMAARFRPGSDGTCLVTATITPHACVVQRWDATKEPFQLSPVFAKANNSAGGSNGPNDKNSNANNNAKMASVPKWALTCTRKIPCVSCVTPSCTHAAATSSNGATFCLSLPDGRVILLNLEDLIILREVPPPSSSTTSTTSSSMSFSSNGLLLALSHPGADEAVSLVRVPLTQKPNAVVLTSSRRLADMALWSLLTGRSYWDVCDVARKEGVERSIAALLTEDFQVLPSSTLKKAHNANFDRLKCALLAQRVDSAADVDDMQMRLLVHHMHALMMSAQSKADIGTTAASINDEDSALAPMLDPWVDIALELALLFINSISTHLASIVQPARVGANYMPGVGVRLQIDIEFVNQVAEMLKFSAGFRRRHPAGKFKPNAGAAERVASALLTADDAIAMLSMLRELQKFTQPTGANEDNNNDVNTILPAPNAPGDKTPDLLHCIDGVGVLPEATKLLKVVPVQPIFAIIRRVKLATGIIGGAALALLRAPRVKLIKSHSAALKPLFDPLRPWLSEGPIDITLAVSHKRRRITCGGHNSSNNNGSGRQTHSVINAKGGWWDVVSGELVATEPTIHVTCTQCSRKSVALCADNNIAQAVAGSNNSNTAANIAHAWNARFAYACPICAGSWRLVELKYPYN